jgi:hypothetical protein
MRKSTTLLLGLLATAAIVPNSRALAAGDSDLRRIVDETVRPLMAEQKIPGMGVPSPSTAKVISSVMEWHRRTAGRKSMRIRFSR